MDDHVQLVLDPEIRNWVLIPLCIIIFLVQALRTYLLEYVKPKHAADIDELRQKCVLLCCIIVSQPSTFRTSQSPCVKIATLSHVWRSSVAFVI